MPECTRNWQHAGKTVFAVTMVPVVITHFIGPNKPWKDPDNTIPPRYKQGLSAFLATHFPGHPQIKPASLAPPSIGFGLREGFRYITRARRLADYFNRFPNQLYAEE